MTVRPFAGDIATADGEVIWKAQRALERQTPVTFIVFENGKSAKPLRTVMVKVAALVKDGDHWLIKTKGTG